MMPTKPKLVIFSLSKKNAKIAAKIGSNEQMIPAFVGLTTFWNLVCKPIVISVAQIAVYKIPNTKYEEKLMCRDSIENPARKKDVANEKTATVIICVVNKIQ